ncbi:MAG: hypothetical protein IPK26_03990 [Planctomycetes bacterium]|nr:hypothetical protein [Planctomycetota bacterium]
MHEDGNGEYFHNSFEADMSLIGSNEKWEAYTGNNAPYPPNGSWSWGFGSNGIAGELSDYGLLNGPAPDGDFVAFLESGVAGPPSFEFAAAVPGAVGATCRISFHAAQATYGFPPTTSRQRVRVSVTPVNGLTAPVVILDEEIRDGVYRRYVTRPFVPATPVIQVKFEGIGAAGNMALLDLVELREVLPWSSASTWNGNAVPTHGSSVTIPPLASVGVQNGLALDVDVQGELFVLEPPTSGPPPQYNLRTRNVVVHGAGGYFQVGLENVPYMGKFELTLDDDRWSYSPSHLPDPAAVNALLVYDRGWVELHGVPKTSWLRLAESAHLLEPILVESVPVNWSPGDKILITSSLLLPDAFDELTIDYITPEPNGNLPPRARIWPVSGQYLTFPHCGRLMPVASPSPLQPNMLDLRAEVAMLTHNIKIQATPRTSIPAGYGGHVMVMSEETNNGAGLGPPGFGRFSQVELQNMGRAGQLGRYPMHWHLLLGNGQGQYMKGCSIVRSNSRVVAVHATDYATFEDNVAFEHFGHAVFIEDGSEENNVFRRNLIAMTRVPTAANALLTSDIRPRVDDLIDPAVFQNQAPSSFWITNPHNVFEDNVVAGSMGTGYWFALPTARMGRSASDGGNQAAAAYFAGRPNPVNRELLVFERNRCHSSWIGIDINDSIGTFSDPSAIQKNTTWQLPRLSPNSPRPMQVPLRDFQVYACNEAIYTGNGDKNLIFDRAVISDCAWSIVMASHDILRNSLVVRDSGNCLMLQSSFPPGRFGLGLYDGAFEVDNVHCVGYGDNVADVSVMRAMGASRRRTGFPFRALTLASSLSALPGPGSAMRALVQDFSVPVPANQDFTLLDDLDPRTWCVSIDVQDGSFGTVPATLVPNHPLMVFSGSPSVGLPASRLFVSPFRFSYLRVEARTMVHPYANPVGNPFSLRIVREGPGNEVVTYDNRWRVDPFKQVAVAAEPAAGANTVRYRLTWLEGLGQIPPPTTDLILSEMKEGESILVGLEGYVPVLQSSNPVQLARELQPYPDERPGTGSNALRNATPATSLADMTTSANLQRTTYFADTVSGTLWIRIVTPVPVLAPPDEPGIEIHANGLGQYVRITL